MVKLELFLLPIMAQFINIVFTTEDAIQYDTYLIVKLCVTSLILQIKQKY